MTKIVIAAVVTALLAALTGCHDPTRTAANQQLTSERQAKIQQHKDAQ